MITLTVNGEPKQVNADPDTPLLYVLRDDLALNGAKYGCRPGRCSRPLSRSRRRNAATALPGW